ncbi:uncharacterized protein DUF4129 [Thermosporothrix hazakensis]|jgi:hypothetical protein|uniref:Uncharacterized protein DUF4129 n=2 Tax=Thermosporothrix TaxID=768650 RepID=A0A326U197_THEHA|nr:DUF4129 domain-containing protein [Thermosporothrix hazakensis]PZW24662.1 uncharacterized protein DUF4129 [Thermosporothrix hazakensis]BBH90354.1 hypothetical protein KTC_51050 [Thermosporothrix sp. COM3]GCE48390.1 hypothetical protein KTH_32590 [Thermosporothrix hazakensis]
MESRTPEQRHPITQEIDLGVGARLLPFLFLGMEACWIYALLVGLTSFRLGGMVTALLPFWGLLLLMEGTGWLARLLERGAALRDETQGTRGATLDTLWLTLWVLALLVPILWGSLYASAFALYDLRWLSHLGSDMLSLSPAFVRIVALLLLAIGLEVRCAVVARQTVHPEQVFRTLRLGLVVIIGAFLVRIVTQTVGDEPALFVLIPLFLGCAVVAHMLANAAFLRMTQGIRKAEAVGFERNQLIVVIVVVILFAVLTYVVWMLATPELAQKTVNVLSSGYTFVIELLVYLVMVLLTPLFWLVEIFWPFFTDLLYALYLAFQRFLDFLDVGKHTATGGRAQTPSEVVFVISRVLFEALRYLVPLAVVLILLLVLRQQLRRYRRMSKPHPYETRESIWSWQLFKQQCITLLLALWQRFFPPKARPEAAYEEVQAETPAWRMRRIYRAFLHWARLRGFPRRHAETASEFEVRLKRHLHTSTTELHVLTTLYNRARYGVSEPSEEEVTRAAHEWQSLQQKADHPHN